MDPVLKICTGIDVVLVLVLAWVAGRYLRHRGRERIAARTDRRQRAELEEELAATRRPHPHDPLLGKPEKSAYALIPLEFGAEVGAASVVGRQATDWGLSEQSRRRAVEEAESLVRQAIRVTRSEESHRLGHAGMTTELSIEMRTTLYPDDLVVEVVVPVARRSQVDRLVLPAPSGMSPALDYEGRVGHRIWRGIPWSQWEPRTGDLPTTTNRQTGQVGKWARVPRGARVAEMTATSWTYGT